MPQLERVGLDYVETAPVVISEIVHVDATPAEVWRVLNETERWPEWFDDMDSATVTSPQWDGVGSRRRVKIGPAEIEEEIVVWEPEQHWGFCGIEANFAGGFAKRLLETVRIAPEGTGSQLRYTGALEPAWFVKPAVGLLKKQIKSGWKTSLANIDNQV